MKINKARKRSCDRRRHYCKNTQRSSLRRGNAWAGPWSEWMNHTDKQRTQQVQACWGGNAQGLCEAPPGIQCDRSGEDKGRSGTRREQRDSQGQNMHSLADNDPDLTYGFNLHVTEKRERVLSNGVKWPIVEESSCYWRRERARMKMGGQWGGCCGGLVHSSSSGGKGIRTYG